MMGLDPSPAVVTLLTVAGGGALTLGGQYVIAWMKGRDVRHVADREADAKLEEHRDSLTFDLLNAAREELTAFRQEVSSLRPLQARVAHLEEALDHLHALLHADSDAEWEAAERRAKGFLKRMRPGVGELRNMKQAGESAETLTGTGNHEGDDYAGKRARRFGRKP